MNDTICHGYFSITINHLQEKLYADIFRVCYFASSGKHREKNEQVDIVNLVRNVSCKVTLEVEVRPYKVPQPRTRNREIVDWEERIHLWYVQQWWQYVNKDKESWVLANVAHVSNERNGGLILFHIHLFYSQHQTTLHIKPQRETFCPPKLGPVRHLTLPNVWQTRLRKIAQNNFWKKWSRSLSLTLKETLLEYRLHQILTSLWLRLRYTEATNHIYILLLSLRCPDISGRDACTAYIGRKAADHRLAVSLPTGGNSRATCD